MKQNVIRIIIMLAVTLTAGSCTTAPVRFFSDTFVIVETDAEDDFTKLAAKYLKDPEKAWVISEFNNMKKAEKGREVVIPLDPFRLGGLSKEGYQTIPVLAYSGISQAALKVHMDMLKRLDVSVITIGQLLKFFAFDIQVPKKSVVLTFDMDFRVFEETVLPVIDAYDHSAALFLTPEMLKTASQPERSFIAGLKDKKIIVCVDGSGLLHFDMIDDLKSFRSTFETQVATIEWLKKCMADTIGENHYYYASDCRYNQSMMVNILMKNGVDAAFNTGGDSNPFFADPYNIQRIAVTDKMDPKVLEKRLVFFKTQGFE